MTLATRDPITLSIGCISVALEMNSSLKRQNLLTEEVGKRIIEVSELSESVIVEISKLVLHLA